MLDVLYYMVLAIMFYPRHANKSLVEEEWSLTQWSSLMNLSRVLRWTVAVSSHLSHNWTCAHVIKSREALGPGDSSLPLVAYRKRLRLFNSSVSRRINKKQIFVCFRMEDVFQDGSKESCFWVNSHKLDRVCSGSNLNMMVFVTFFYFLTSVLFSSFSGRLGNLELDLNQSFFPGPTQSKNDFIQEKKQGVTKGEEESGLILDFSTSWFMLQETDGWKDGWRD